MFDQGNSILGAEVSLARLELGLRVRSGGSVGSGCFRTRVNTSGLVSSTLLYSQVFFGKAVRTRSIASKWAVEALHESLAQEVKPFGIKVTLIEPGAYATDFGKSAKAADVLQPYADFRKRIMANLVNAERGDPHATPKAILKLVDTHNPPERFAVGSAVLPMARAAYADRLATWEAWEAVSNAAQGEPAKNTIASLPL